MPTSLRRMLIVARLPAPAMRAKAIGVTVQRDEPSIEAQRISLARVIDGKKHAGDSSVTIASLGQAAMDPLMEARSALGRRDYATAQRLMPLGSSVKSRARGSPGSSCLLPPSRVPQPRVWPTCKGERLLRDSHRKRFQGFVKFPDMRRGQ